ncbi:MAG: helix-turn-helix domain-containing protein [bacterium]|nr:helix-turn-helix domain-containing protein [bacterium]
MIIYLTTHNIFVIFKSMYKYIKEIENKLKSYTSLPVWIKNRMSVCNQIKFLRKALGMSQKILAHRIGTQQSAIARIEKNAATLNLSHLEKIAAALESELVVMIVPGNPITKTIREKALKKASEIIAETKVNSLIEQQAPDKNDINNATTELVEKLISGNNSIIWK